MYSESEDLVFALDIGTRTVVGVVGVQEEKRFRVIATELVEHKNRAMLDGQIHDIEQVADAVRAVKDKLEARLGLGLKKAAIAAAGRVLRTCQVRVDKNIEPGYEIDAGFVSSLEVEGIQKAQMLLDDEAYTGDKTQFYCVGYSVINYYLNGFVISKLVGHKGKNAGADILATFLPQIVVDSLYTVISKVGLEVSSLTLEPIAAINVAIPADLRLLNLALVDIGAGTSDIALTRDGSIVAFAMVPVAGDEITESISQQYLVDFNTAEKIKLTLSSGKEKIHFTDILKIKRTVSRDEAIKVIGDTLHQLAETITQKILEYNHKSPNAVFLVGGGSKIPGLPELIARQMGLPQERVAVRGRDVIRDVIFSDRKLNGPESITPYGIAVTAQMYGGRDFLSVAVNGRKLKLFNSKKLTVADALILYGFDAGRLIGRTGKGISYFVNGEKRHARGEYGSAAEITVNGKAASIDTPVSYGDNIEVVPARDGKDAEVWAYELVSSGFRTGSVKLNGNPVDISTSITVNGRRITENVRIKEGDSVVISQIGTLRELLAAGGMNFDGCEISVNGSGDCSPDYRLKNGDTIICKEKTTENHGESHAEGAMQAAGTTALKVKEAAQAVEKAADIDAEKAVPKGNADTSNTACVDLKSGMKVVVNGKAVVLNGGKSQYIFVDIFNYVDFDLTKPKGTITLKLNGRQAAFTDVIREGDVIDIYWNR